MYCWKCGNKTDVVDTRKGVKAGLDVQQRKRVCTNENCGEKFRTYEIYDQDLKIFAEYWERIEQSRTLVEQLRKIL